MVLDAATCVAMVASFKLSIKRTAASRPPVSSKWQLNIAGRITRPPALGIGRALRAAVDLEALGERSITVDCDVIQADGGTRTASITGGFVALAMACQRLVEEGVLEKTPLRHYISAISVGIVDGEPMLDLCYVEDSAAEVDMNIVVNDAGGFVELQGTGEHGTFSQEQLHQLLALGEKGNRELQALQKKALDGLEL